MVRLSAVASDGVVSPRFDAVHRVVFPTIDPETRLALYAHCSSGATPVGRHQASVPVGEVIEFDTYFNAFPASYWQRWSSAARVRLDVVFSGSARVCLVRSNAHGDSELVQQREATGNASFEIPLTDFDHGGWLWFSIAAVSADVRLEQATWSVPSNDRPAGRVTLAITTFNRPDDCVQQMQAVLAEPELRERLDRLIIVDQGTHAVREAHGFAAAAAALGDQFALIEQPNLGGSGGYTRGMLEAVSAGSDYVLLVDDDASPEPEGILRALDFDDHAQSPLVVGAHMLNANSPTVLHSFGETIDENRFWWEAVDPRLSTIDLAENPLATTPPLHKRIDVAYNGWWMCLIPTAALREVGYSLPFFIKWDDAEFGLRAAEGGFPTVSLPGAAAWHVPWTAKDDGLDWQAYFHVRNRVVTALLHSSRPHGGRLLRDLFMGDVNHLVCMQYTVAELRLLALEDVLSGPAHLFPSLSTRASEARELFASARDLPTHNPADFPAARNEVPIDDPRNQRPSNPVSLVLRVCAAVAHQWRKPSPPSDGTVEVRVPASVGKWWRIGVLDSAAVSTADGSGQFVYRRDRARFRTLLRRSRTLNQQLRKSWDRVAADYRHALPELVSADAWRHEFTDRAQA